MKHSSSLRVLVVRVADWDAASAAPRLAAAAIAVLAPAFRNARRLGLLAMKMRVYPSRAHSSHNAIPSGTSATA